MAETKTGGGASISGEVSPGGDFTGRDRIVITPQDRETLFHILYQLQIDARLTNQAINDLPAMRREVDAIARQMERFATIEQGWDRRMEVMDKNWERRLAVIQTDWENRFSLFKEDWGKRLVPLYVGMGLLVIASVANLIWQ